MNNIKIEINKLQKHAMTGLSYMGPLFTMAALVRVCAVLTKNTSFIDLSTYLNQFSGILFSLILPVFSMFIAYSIADKPGLMPGLAAGWIASNSIGKLPDTGFFGTLILAFIAGFLVKFIAEKVKFKDLYNSTVPTFIIPLLSIVFLVLIHVFFIAPIFGSFNQVVIRLAKESGMLGQLIYAIITAAAVAADLGGPVNKTAILIGTPLSAEFIMPMTAINLAIVIPPLGIGLSTMIDRLLKKHGVYDEDMREEGKNAFNLGLIAISEGGLPFLYEKPKGTMIVNVIGSVTGSVIAVAMGAVFWYPIPSLWGWLFVDNIPAYITGLAAGVLITAIGNVIIRLRE